MTTSADRYGFFTLLLQAHEAVGTTSTRRALGSEEGIDAGITKHSPDVNLVAGANRCLALSPAPSPGYMPEGHP